MTSKPTTLWSDIDFERDGKQIDWLYLPHSVTRSAYGEIMIPIAVVKRGKGPTVLLMAGNHGDEYEGQIGRPCGATSTSRARASRSTGSICRIR